MPLIIQIIQMLPLKTQRVKVEPKLESQCLLTRAQKENLNTA